MDNVKISIKELTSAKEILDACRVTVWKGEAPKEPSDLFMRNIYRSEHSPIRDRWFVVTIEDIPSWIATHFARHGIGFTPYVSTQREDRIDYDIPRDEKKQGDLVNMRMTLNAQSIINISKVRLCNMAHSRTRKIWQKVITELTKYDFALAKCCVPSCVYRGFCPEGKQDTCYKGKEAWRESYIKHQLKEW